MKTAIVVGSGPAGLMAADQLAQQGVSVTVVEAKPSVGRKFLMAGKSGLNLTKAEPTDALLSAYAEATGPLQQMIGAFDADAVQDWAKGLGQEVFTGTTGRVFPKAMKASPLLRAWLARLQGLGVETLTKTRWNGWDADQLCFDGPDGAFQRTPDVTVLALGGASWARLGADGLWAQSLGEIGVPMAPFAPANAGIAVAWSDHMARHFGAALKNIVLTAGPYQSRGEAVISASGLEGGGIYSVSRGVREGADLVVDLLPQWDVDAIVDRLRKPRGKASLSNHLRKVLKLSPAEIALLQEAARPLPEGPFKLAKRIKGLRIPVAGLAPMDQAISTAGGVPFEALTDGLMLRARPGVFVAGEMLDWEAPTGGYLITGCLATGRWAGQHAARYALGKKDEDHGAQPPA